MKYTSIEITADPHGRDLVFYMPADDGIYISPDIRELIRLKGTSAVVNKDALKMFLIFRYVPTRETIVKDIFRLSPGSTLRYTKEKGLVIEEYSRPVFSPAGKSMEKAVDDIRSAVNAAVKKCNAGCQEKIGCFLSGGVDSSYLAAVLKPDASFTFGAKGYESDESGYAKELSRKLSMENYSCFIDGDDYFDKIPLVQRIIGQPYANLTGVPVYCMAKTASEKVHVVFSGEGPDETFGGYGAYRTGRYEKLYRKLPLWLRRLLHKILSPVSGKRLRNFLYECSFPVEETYIGMTKNMYDRDANRLLAPGYRSSLQYKDVTASYFKKIRSGSDLDKKQYLDCCLWGPFDNVYSLYLMGKHFGLDIRTPYMEDAVINSALSLSENQRVDGLATKIAFRKAAEEVLPEEICSRPKQGMPLPYGEWIRDEKHLAQMEKAFSEPFVSEFFDTKLLEKMLDDCRLGKKDNSLTLFTVYCFVLWYESFKELTGRE